MNDYVTRQEFQKVFTILERIELKLEEHDRRFDAHDRSFLAINTTFAAIDKRFDKVEESVRHEGVMRERLEKKVDTVIEVLGTKASKQDVEDLRDEVKQGFADLRAEIRSRG